MVSSERVAKWGHEITLASPSVQSVFVTAFLLITMGLNLTKATVILPFLSHSHKQSVEHQKPDLKEN